MDNNFRLARELKYLGVEPTRDRLLTVGLELECHFLGKDFEQVVGDVVEKWAKVATTAKENDLVRAMGYADREWAKFKDWGVAEERRAKILALVWYLHFVTADREIVPEFVGVPRDRIGQWLGICGKTAGKYIRELADSGLIQFRDNGDFSYKARESREAKFVGLQTDVHDSCGNEVQDPTDRLTGMARIQNYEDSVLFVAWDLGQRRDVGVCERRVGDEGGDVLRDREREEDAPSSG